MDRVSANKAVNADAFFVRCAHYKCAGYGWHCADEKKQKSAYTFPHNLWLQ
jgi:hypothetical protein